MLLKSAIALIAASIILSSCEKRYDDSLKKFEATVSKTRIGEGSDVWLLKFNAMGDWEKVVLVFGFIDDYKFCDDIAGLYMSKYPGERYSCLLAN